ncbi:hypothetical protein, conserved [Babesia bigemina]|uniref:Uncharacterized protein n=1 Tax=Babesia bigemina TaxID=5866 RepID=A0A061D993_BABBI|nr:hypothetical protein, conserved [Babesia bigemina]CDR97113.1 hypothetical protein, conserved [Babesia bigemina]|eukprot:XP_012769299.1 hypothetical protein, conserved [Babesia bigemina]
MANDDLEHGLFEDSEESSVEDNTAPYLTTVEDPPTQEFAAPAAEAVAALEVKPEPVTRKVINKTIPSSAYPVRDHHLVICKFPLAVSMSASPFTEMEERQRLRQNPKLLEEPQSSENAAMMRWRFGQAPEGDSEPFGVLETNTHFVEWDDGTFTLFVGKTPFNVDYRSETVFLLEDSRPDLKPVHAVITDRLQMKFSNILKNKFTRSKDVGAKRQRMTLTSIADAVSSKISLQRHRIMVRENERFRRIQQSTTYGPRGLTRQFLESDSDSQ